MKCLAALGEQYHDQATPGGLAEQDEALLFLGMPGVVGDAAERIAEHGSRLLKRDFVLDTVSRCLWSVPLEPRGFGQRCGLRSAGCA